MNTEQVRHVDDAITSRHSVRAFLDTPVDVQTIKDILAVSSRAPSGTNTQPWKVYVVTGQKRAEMIDRVCAAQIELHQKPQLADLYIRLLPLLLDTLKRDRKSTRLNSSHT